MAKVNKPLEVLDALFFAGPAGVVGLVIYDNGYAVKATTAPVPPMPPGVDTVSAERMDTLYVLNKGAPFPLAGALAMSGAARAAHAKYEPPTTTPGDATERWYASLVQLLEAVKTATPEQMTDLLDQLRVDNTRARMRRHAAEASAEDPPPMATWAGFRPPVNEDPPWTYNDLTAFELSPAASVGPCGCSREASAACWHTATAGATNLACYWRALGWVPYRPAPADPPPPGAIELHSFSDIDLGTATPPAPAAPCNCTPGENQHCYFVRPRGLPGCVHVAESRAATRRVDPPAPAVGLSHEE